MFNSECKLHKYSSVAEIIDDFYGVRLATYQKRKNAQIVAMEKKLIKLSNRARYIQETLVGTVDLRKKNAVQVVELMVSRKFEPLDGDYKYLVKMPMDSVTQENVDSIMKENTQCAMELDILRKTTLEQIWSRELTQFENEYISYKGRREKLQLSGAIVKPSKKPTKK
jgi:DNA topoisomerase-2